MRLPGFTAVLAFGNSRRRYYQGARAVAGTQGILLPADNPSGGKGGGISGGGWCPAQPWKLAPPGACAADGTKWGCDNVGPPGYPGDGGGGPVGGPPRHGPVLF